TLGNSHTTNQKATHRPFGTRRANHRLALAQLAMSQPPVDLPPMRHPYHQHNEPVVVEFVNHAVVTGTHSVGSFFADELAASRRPWVFGQHAEQPVDRLLDHFGQLAEGAFSPGCDLDPIGHRPRSALICSHGIGWPPSSRTRASSSRSSASW